MSNFRVPGPVCGYNAPPIDEGTLVKWWSSAPSAVCKLPEPITLQWHHYSRAGGFPAATLKMSPEAVSLLKAIETPRLKPYFDGTGKEVIEWCQGATIGYGHLIAKADWPKYKTGITKEQAEELFLADAKPFESAVRETISVGIQQYQFDALVIYAFNIGDQGFRTCSVANRINDPKASGKEPSLKILWTTHYITSAGKFMQGLVNRRECEWRIFESGVYVRW